MVELTCAICGGIASCWSEVVVHSYGSREIITISCCGRTVETSPLAIAQDPCIRRQVPARGSVRSGEV